MDSLSQFYKNFPSLKIDHTQLCEGAEIPQAPDNENVSKKRLYLGFRTGRGAPNPLLDSNLELGRIDS